MIGNGYKVVIVAAVVLNHFLRRFGSIRVGGVGVEVALVEIAGNIEGEVAHGSTSAANEKQARAAATRLFTLPPKPVLCCVFEDGLTFVAILHFIEPEQVT